MIRRQAAAAGSQTAPNADGMGVTTPRKPHDSYYLAEAAKILGVSQSYLRSKLRDHTFAGTKGAGRWAMTEPQIEAAIEAMGLDARPPDPPSPSGLSKHSRFGRRLQSRRGA
jgi:hypothetical protein